MPVTKKIDGRTPSCSGNPVVCTDTVMGDVTGKFGIRLYADFSPADPTKGAEGGWANPLSPVVPVPPVFDPAAPVGVPFSICEVPSPAGWKLLATGDVTLTPTPMPQGFITNPVVYDPKTFDSSIGANNRCFDVLIPQGTTEFAISINNVPLSKIIVKKATLPAGDTATDFVFTPTNWDGSSFTLKDGGEKDSGYISGGSGYAAAEGSDANYYLKNLVCDSTIPSGINANRQSTYTYTGASTNPTNGFENGDNKANITLQNGATVTCTFTNEKFGQIKVTKTAVGGDGTFDFTSNFQFDPTITTQGGTGTKTKGGLVAGSTYNLAETPEAGWLITSALACKLNDGAGATTGTVAGNGLTGIQVVAGQITACTITNTKKASLTVVKDCFPDDAENIFAFTLAGGSNNGVPASFNLRCKGTPNNGTPFERLIIDDSKILTVTDLNTWLGDKVYTIAEAANQPGWALESIVCTGGGADTVTSLANRTATVNLDAGEDVVCTFNNKAIPPQRFTGGGSFYPNHTDSDVLGQNSPFDATRITHGFTLHCNEKVDPNRLEVNWAGDNSLRGRASENNFHLESLTKVQCQDDKKGGFSRNTNPNSNNGDSGIDEESPNAGVDTIEGWGVGKFNNVDGAKVHFIFTDAGEPGKDRDEVWIVIYAPSAAGVLGPEVLRVGGQWDDADGNISTGNYIRLGINQLLPLNVLNPNGSLNTQQTLDKLVPNGATCSTGAVLCTSGPNLTGNGRYGPDETGSRTGVDGADIQSGNQQAHKGTNNQ